MATVRLLSWRQIRDEKFPRSRSWIKLAVAQGRFPAPVPGTCPSLWREEDVDRFITRYIAESKDRAEAVAQATAKATAARVQRREALQQA